MYTVLIIEECIVGALIGRGGRNINNIETVSGAMVKIMESQTKDTYKVIVIGEDTAQNIATQMIQEICRKKVLSVETRISQPLPWSKRRRPYSTDDYSLSSSSSSPSSSSASPSPSSASLSSPSSASLSSPLSTPSSSSSLSTPSSSLSLSTPSSSSSLSTPSLSTPSSSSLSTPPSSLSSSSPPPPPSIKPVAETEREEVEEPLPPIVKNFYTEHNYVKYMSVESANAIRLAKNHIVIKYLNTGDSPRPIPKPVETFKHAFYQYPEIMNVIKEQLFVRPTPLQCQAWPVIMSGHNLIAIAQTGAGKTLAYVLPALIHLTYQPTPSKERIGPTVLVLSTTSELVLQIEREIKKYRFDGIDVLSVYDGIPIASQINSLLYNKSEIVVATPDRLSDLVNVKAVKLNHVSYLVFDGADRMLDMRFKPEIKLALRYVRRDTQVILTSTKWSRTVRNFASYFIADPLYISIGSFDLTTMKTVEQSVIIIKKSNKINWLKNFLKNFLSEDDKVLIFMNTVEDVDEHCKIAQDLNIQCRGIHNRRSQSEIKKILSEFRNGLVSVLIAANSVSRELDVHNLTLVINYDFPRDIEEYVYRVGRTGRAGKPGSVISLFMNSDKPYASSLISVLKNSKQPVPIKLRTMIE